MRLVPTLLRLGIMLAVLSLLVGIAQAAGDVPASQIYVLSVLAAVVVATAGVIAWVDHRIDKRVDDKLAPLKEQVEALYNHLIRQ